MGFASYKAFDISLDNFTVIDASHTYTSSTFFVNGDTFILPYRLHTYLGLNSNGSPY